MKAVSTSVISLSAATARRIAWLLVFSSCMALGGYAQIDVAIGTGTAGNTGTTYPCPLQDYFEGSRAQFLYRASELQAAGMSLGFITALRYQATVQNTYSGSIEQMTVRMANISVASLDLTRWEAVPAIPVFGPVNYFAAVGINTISLAQPFFWNGTDNLLIEICNGDPNSGDAGVNTFTNNLTVPWTTGLSFNASHTYRADNIGYACGATAVTNTGTATTRPNIVFAFTPAVACAGTPSAGNVASTLATACLGDVFTLSSNGATIGTGLTYQWERSADSAAWQPIQGATGINYTTSQSATTFYRLRVTCTNSNLSAVSAGVKVFTPPLPGGNYIINKAITDAASLYPNTNTFNSFVSAYNALSCGISSAVVFTVAPGSGPYEEQLLIAGRVRGSSETNTITFNGNNNTIRFATTSAQRAVIQLNGARHFIFEKLRIEPTGTAAGFGFQLLNNADSNVLRNSEIVVTTSSTANTFAGIVISGSATDPIAQGTTLCDFNRFYYNKITGGFYGITLTATTNNTGVCFVNEFVGNEVRDFYNYGMYVTGSNRILVDSNYFSRPARTVVGPFQGIYFTGNSENATISRNRIFNPFGGIPTSANEFNGINFQNVTAQNGSDNTIVNNLIYHVTGNGIQSGIHNSASAFALYIHNTVTLDDANSITANATRGLYQNAAAASVQFYNNIINVTRGGNGFKYGIYAGNITSLLSDYNNVYVAGSGTNNFFGFYQSNRADLLAWQNASGQDLNSRSLPPLFRDAAAGDYRPSQGAIDNRGFPLNIPEDITGATRSTTKPDLGAFEFDADACASPVVGGKVTVSANGICSGQQAKLSLDGNSWGLNLQFKWQVAATAAGPFADFGGAMDAPDTSFFASQKGYFRCELNCDGTIVYSDTLLLNVVPKFAAGTYTINKNAPPSYVEGVPGGNFISFASAVDAMKCGIDGLGDVVFNVVAGADAYSEQVIIDSITGTSPTARIIFRGNGNTLAFSSTNANEKAVFKITNTSYVIVDSLVLDARGSGSQGFVVHLIRNADYNTFRNCTMLTSTTLTSTNFAGVVISGVANVPISGTAALCDNNLFEKNMIRGGFYGFVFSGGTTAGTASANNRIVNNQIEDFYNYGIYIADGNASVEISGNAISRPVRSGVTSGIGIFLSGTNITAALIEKNRISNFFGADPASPAAATGILLNNAVTTSGNPHRVVNNIVYNMTGNGAVVGIQNTRTSFVDILHNTISLDAVSATALNTTRGFYQNVAASGIRFLNNIISIQRGGTGTKHGLYFETATSVIESDNNCIYVNSAGGNNFTGFASGANRATLAAWVTATQQDSSSIDLNPLFTNAAGGNFTPQLAPLDNLGTTVNVDSDIDGKPRNATAPDPGAIEFSIADCVAPSATTATASPNSNLCVGNPFTLDIPGTISFNKLRFLWQNGATATGPWTNISDTLDAPRFSTAARSNPHYRAVIFCSSNTLFSSVVTLNMNLLLAGGSYTINNTQPTNYTGVPGANFNSFADAIKAMDCGIGGPVVFNVAPGANGVYNEQFRLHGIAGVSAVNTITFSGVAGNQGAVTISYQPNAVDSNYVVKLDSIRFVTFRNLTIANSSSIFGHVVEFGAAAANDSIVSCRLLGYTTNTTSPNLATIFGNSLRGGGNRIIDNIIEGGSIGVYLSGASVSAPAPAGTIVRGNTISKTFSHGIVVQNMRAPQLISNTVTMKAPLSSGSTGILLAALDSAFIAARNQVLLDSVVSGLTYGISVNNSINNSKDSSALVGNRVEAKGNNLAAVFGIYITGSRNIYAANNVMAINGAGSAAYGLYLAPGSSSVRCYNNTVNMRAALQNSYAAYLSGSASSGNLVLRNNIFSNEGGGRAVWLSNTSHFSSDYNLLHTNGAVLVQQATGTPAQFATLPAWKAASNWDRNSIGIAPAFTDTVTLRPNAAEPGSWAIQGRGVQIKWNRQDINGLSRADSLTGGVPDLGAYEFFPTVPPPALTAIPATPVSGQVQAFLFGTDTVMKLKWNGAAPASVEVRRYSGVVPAGLVQPREDSMFFYTSVTVPAPNTYNYDAELFYIDPWLGSVLEASRLGMGRTTPGNAWVVGTDSKVQTSKKIISQANVSFLDRYTGLINPAVLVTNNQDSSSNWGRNFWVGYQRTNGFTSNGQQMVLYLGARDQEANVRVEINGTNWVRNYTVPPFTAITSDLIPKTGPDDARMIAEGQLNRGIHIISDVPIVAYAHIYEAANSGATLLLPVGVWGYEYFTLNSRQYYGTAGSASVFHVIADRDSTWVEITPARPSQAGLQAGVPVVVKLNKGETYQVLGGVLSGSEGQDLSGSIVRSVPNGQGACYPIAVFAGSTRTGIGCGTATGGSGDLIIQQIFPSQAWGTTYLLAPTSNQNGPGATAHMTNKYRVMVRDTATVVLRNGVALPKSGIIRNRYYEFESNTADYIEADNPVLVAQYISSAGSCPNTTGDGDPEMFYLSPLQQAIKQTYFYRNITNAIDENFLTIVVPDEGLNSLNIDGRPYSSYGANEMFAYQHRYAGYTVVTKRWEKVAGASSVECDQPFTGIVYGIGSVESYGYNVGTLVKNLNYSSTIQNQLNTSGVPYDYTCSGAPFFMNALLTLHPDSIYWRINEVPGLTPSANMMSRNPQAMDTVDIGGVTFYVFRLNQSLRMNPPGVYSVPFDYWHPSIEGCDKRQSGTVYLQVLPKHPTNFAVALSGGGAQACAGETATFTGELTSSNGFRIQSWSWQANNGTANPVTGTNRVLANVPYNTAGTYNVTLNSVTQDGCISDTTRQVVIKPVPTVATIGDVTICPGDNAILSIASPVAGTRYYWYTAATGGSPIDSGTSIVVTNPAVGSSYYAEAVLNACISTTRARSSISQYTKLATPVVTLDGATDKEVRFRWTSVAGATRYEIVVRLNGVVSGNPVTVPAGTITYVVSNLPQGTTVEISVRALADAACQASDAGTASGFTYVDQVYIPNVFTPNGDGINDRLYVYSYVVRTMQMAIFNQWGEKVFESNNMLCTNNANCPGTGWDGNFNGKPLPMGVYMFVGKFTLNSGEIVERKGSINLVR